MSVLECKQSPLLEKGKGASQILAQTKKLGEHRTLLSYHLSLESHVTCVLCSFSYSSQSMTVAQIWVGDMAEQVIQKY